MRLILDTIMPSAASKDNKMIMKIDLKGSLDNNNTQEFDFVMTTLINGGAKKIILDIDGLQYLDSTGIGSIIGFTKKLRKKNGEVVITRYTSQILTILKPINMEKFIQFFPTVEEGVSYLKSIEIN